MVFKQGNTYKLKATIDAELSTIDKIVFQFNDVQKSYLSDGTGNVTLENGVFIVPLTQEDTLTLDPEVNAEVAVKFQDGSVKRSRVIENLALDTIIEEEI
jgi:hypothetical protein